MKQTLTAVATSALLATTLPATVIAQDASLESPEAQVSYGLGMMIGERVLKQYGDLDYDLVVEAMKAQAAGEETRMNRCGLPD